MVLREIQTNKIIVRVCTLVCKLPPPPPPSLPPSLPASLAPRGITSCTNRSTPPIPTPGFRTGDYPFSLSRAFVRLIDKYTIIYTRNETRSSWQPCYYRRFCCFYSQQQHEYSDVVESKSVVNGLADTRTFARQ